MAKKDEYPKPEKRADPVRGWKASALQLHIENNWQLHAQFVSQNGVGFKQTDVAEHSATFGFHPHPAEKFKVDCSCGFYAVHDDKKPEYFGWLLEVDLYGTVIEGSNGWYRASKQRVLSATMPVACQACEQNVSEVIGITGMTIQAICRVCMRQSYAIITADALAALLGCEIKTHSLINKLGPSTIINVPVNPNINVQGGNRELTLPTEYMGAFQKNVTWMYDAQIMKNFSLGMRFTVRGDNTENGFFLELSDFSGMRLGEWHFQAAKP